MSISGGNRPHLYHQCNKLNVKHFFNIVYYSFIFIPLPNIADTQMNIYFYSDFGKKQSIGKWFEDTGYMRVLNDSREAAFTTGVHNL